MSIRDPLISNLEAIQVLTLEPDILYKAKNFIASHGCTDTLLFCAYSQKLSDCKGLNLAFVFLS